MTSRSPTAGKRRPALATLQHGMPAASAGHRRSSIAKPANLDTPADVAGKSPAMKKPRRSASKRVSFGGEHIKLFNNEHETEWGESPPFALEPKSQDLSTSSPLPGAGAGASPVLPRGRNSPRGRDSPAPSPRRSPRFGSTALEESNDADGDDGDTLTLPHMSEMIQDQTGTPQRLSRSPLFMDEDVTPGAAAPRLSVAGGCGDDTTVIVPIPAPVESLNDESGDGKVRQRRESMQSNLSDGDITQQIPRMNGLLDIDEAYDGTSDGGLCESPGFKGTSSPFANIDEVTKSIGDNDSTVGNVTSEAAPLVSLLAEDAGAGDIPQRNSNRKAEQSPHNATLGDGPSPTCSSPGTSGRASIGDITLGIPHVEALLSIDEPSSPAESEHKEVAATVPGPTSMTPPRPVLPESRQLFSSEMQGDDTTIHYHDTNPQIGNVQQSLPVASEGRSSPSCADARSTSKDDCLQDNELSESPVKAQPVTCSSALEPQAESSNVLQPSALCESETLGAVESETQVISDFLEGVNVQFREVDFKALQRGASLGFGLERGESDGEETENTEDSKRAALFKRVYSAARSSVILKRLNKAVKDMQEEVASRQCRVAELSAKISRNPPKYFERVIDSEKLKQSELSKMQLEFKRLRKASAMQAKREHAILRSEREQRIGEQECHQIATLQSDQGLLQSNTEVFTSEVQQVDASVNEHGLQEFVDQVVGMETDLAVTQTLRSEVRSRVAALAGTKECIDNAASKRETIVSEISSLTHRTEELKTEVSRLQDYARASSGHELKKLLERHRDEHALLSRVTGVQALMLSDSHVRVRVLDILDVHFELQESSVASTRCSASPRSMARDAECPFESFVADAISSVDERCLKNTAVVHDIPATLQRCVAFLRRVLNVQQGLAVYQRTREVSYERSNGSRASSSGAEVTMRAEYFSLSKHCKFDVVLSVLATAPAWESATALAGDFTIQVDDVDAIIGKCPDKVAVSDAVRAATTSCKQDAVLEALQSIWRLLG